MTNLVKKLSGHSGCEILLVKYGENYAVRKKSGSKDYNARLRTQCAKQMATPGVGVFSPKVIRTFTEDGLFGFEMEYVEGMTLAEYLGGMPAAEIRGFIKSLFAALHLNSSTPDPQAPEIFGRKISGLKYLAKRYANLREPFEMLESFDWGCVCKSRCHGDLTLENIIITPDKKLYLIDFLDSFYDSWMMDIAKVLQDLEAKWSYRSKAPDKNRDINLFAAGNALAEEINRLENGPKIMQTCLHILMLNLVRIYPYLKDRKTQEFLDEALAALAEKLKKGL